MQLKAGIPGAQKLIEHSLRLVVYIARKFDNTGVGLGASSRSGDRTYRGDQYIQHRAENQARHYASRCIENEILMYLRRTVKIIVSFDEPLNIDWDGNRLMLSDILGTESDMVYQCIENEVEKELLRGAMDKLDDREKRSCACDSGWAAPGRERKRKWLTYWAFRSPIFPV